MVHAVCESRTLNNVTGHCASFLDDGGEKHCCGVQRSKEGFEM